MRRALGFTSMVAALALCAIAAASDIPPHRNAASAADVPEGPIYLVRVNYDAITGEVAGRSVMTGPYALDECLGKLRADWLPSPVLADSKPGAFLTRVECNVITLPAKSL